METIEEMLPCLKPLDYFPGTFIEKDMLAINLDPHGQAVLTLQSPCSPVVH